jgi:hypothetical protein
MACWAGSLSKRMSIAPSLMITICGSGSQRHARPSGSCNDTARLAERPNGRASDQRPLTADHWQYAFAGRVRDLRRGMQRRRRGFRCFGLCLAWSVDHERQCSHRKC